jgi:hypothetical protein
MGGDCVQHPTAGFSVNAASDSPFGVTRRPAVLFVDGERNVTSDGRITYQAIQPSIVQLFGGAITATRRPVVRQLVAIDDFNRECRGNM